MDEADTAQDIAGDNTQSTEEILAPLGQKNTTSIKAEPDSSASEFDALFSRLSNQGSHDPHTWKRLIRLASGSGEISKIHHAYDELLKRYPNTSSAQIAHIGHFLNGEATFAEAERLFIKYLRGSPDVDLWKFYLDYVRRRNVDPKTRGIVRDSYEFALKHVGQDKNAGKIWYDYIQFLKAGDAFSTSEEQQKMDAIRKAYHRAVKIPLDDVERIWFELETFENSLNKITAKRFTSDLSPAYMKARAVLKPLTSHLNALYPSSQDFFLPSLPVFDAADRNLVGRWKAYLKWEESNPLEIEDQEKEALNRRIQGVYRKAVIRMRFYPEIWYMAYNWTKSIGKPDDALLILKAGMDANPTSYLLTFVYVEVMEREKDYAEVHTTFERFLGLQSKILDELQDSPEVTANGSFNGSHPASQSTNGSFGSQSSDNKPPKLTELQERRTEYGLVYVLYMRFARRAEGLQALRKVFGKARKDKWATWEVYEANALMEYHCFDNKAVANRIFEKGLEHFGDEVEYVSCYLGFLISINDGNNARALFERVRTTFSPEQARPLWERWSRYEYQYGDLESARKLGKQVSEAYPNDPPIKLFAQRHVYLGVDAIAARDLGAAYARRHHVNNGTTASTSSSSQARGMEISQSLIPGKSQNAVKRPPSPDPGCGIKREDDRRVYGAEFQSGYKRARAGGSPTRADRGVSIRDWDRDRRDRDRWAGEEGVGRRRFSTGLAGARSGRNREDRDRGCGWLSGQDTKREESSPSLGPNLLGTGSGVTIPPIVSWFIGELPSTSLFDGPVFKTDDFLKCFKQAIIPGSTGDRPSGATGGSPPRGRSPVPYHHLPQHHREVNRPLK